MGAQPPHRGRVREALPLQLRLREGPPGRSSRRTAGWATLNYDPKTNIAWYGSLHLNTRYLTSAAVRRKTACHELGHVFGLEHRRTGRTCMRDGFDTMYAHPDAVD